jgi:glycosyltransferase involved in cell wall biosynthesis
METKPSTVSVVIPAYNRENYVAEAIRSALGQTYPVGEIIVVDDGSTDGTGDIARSFGGLVRCQTQGHLGISRARNAGIAAAQGEFIALLDSDDLWLPQKLERQVRHLEAHPETEMVFGQMQAFISPELEATYGRKIDTSIVPVANASTVLLRKKTFARIGSFHHEKDGAEFIDWYSRAQDLGVTSFILPELVTRRRIHLNHSVRNRVRSHSSYAQVLKSILEYRRTVGSTLSVGR